MTTDRSREVTTLRRLHDLMNQVNARTDLQEVLQMIAEGVADVLGFEVAVISYLHPEEVFEVVAVAGDDSAKEQLLGTRTPQEQFIAEFELAEEWGTLRFVPHERLPESEVAGWIPDVQPLDIPNAWHPLDALFAPLLAPTGELVGMLSVDLPQDGQRPGQFQREVLEMYAAQAGTAINNARQRSRLMDQVRLAETVHAIAHTTGRALELGAVIDGSLQPVVSGLRCHGAWIRAFEGAGERPGRGRGAFHPDPGLAPTDELVTLARRVATDCWAEQRGLIVSDTVQPPVRLVSPGELARVREFLGAVGSHTLLFVPIGVGPECLGYMLLTRTADDPAWTEQEVAAAREIGRDLGRAVLHARLFEREREIVQELQELDAYKTELISTVTHELKSPLTSIMLSLEFLEADDIPPETVQWVRSIERNTARLRTLVEDLLLLSKVRDPNQPLIPSPVDVSAVVGDVVDMVRMQADKRSVALKLLHPEAPVVAWGDQAELDRVVTNLVGNAIKFSADGGTVTLALETYDDHVCFSCTDEGLGISTEDQERLFTEFYRSSNPAALSVPGTGLGLTIVQRIVDRHEGTIAVDSELGVGSTFTVTLPRPPEGVPGG